MFIHNDTFGHQNTWARLSTQYSIIVFSETVTVTALVNSCLSSSGLLPGNKISNILFSFYIVAISTNQLKLRCTLAICDLMLLFCVNLFLHMEHSKGLLPEWSLMWHVRPQTEVNDLLQTLQTRFFFTILLDCK